MTIEQIIQNKLSLNTELYHALSTMEKSDKIKEIRERIKANQEACPHYSEKFNLEIKDGTCPYCGKHIKE